MGLLGDDQLERSAVVANCRMNLERDLFGSNGYDRELGLDPLDFLKGRAASDRTAAWLSYVNCQAERVLGRQPVERPCAGLTCGTTA